MRPARPNPDGAGAESLRSSASITASRLNDLKLRWEWDPLRDALCSQELIAPGTALNRSLHKRILTVTVSADAMFVKITLCEVHSENQDRDQTEI